MCMLGPTMTMSSRAVDGNMLYMDLQLTVCAVLLKVHPKPLKHTPSFEFTTSFLGVAFGVAVGVNTAFEAGLYDQASLVQHVFTAEGGIAVLRRLALGGSAPVT